MEITYFIGGNKKMIKLNEAYQDDNLEVTVIKKDNHYQMTVTPKRPLKIESAKAFYHHDYKKSEFIYSNGYQSWTPSKEYPINGKIKGLNFIPKSVIDKNALDSYGDYGFYHYKNRSGVIHSHSYTYIRNASNFTLLGSLDESIGYTIFEHNTKINQITIFKDLEGLEIDTRTVLLDTVILSGEEIVIDDYFNLIKSDHARIDSLFGYSTGYYYSSNITSRIISTNLQAIKDNSLPFDAFVIDEGHQSKVGDWLKTDPEKFPDGLGPLVSEIHGQDLKAGIYLAPFVASGDSELYLSHPDWFINDVKSGMEWGGHYPLNLELDEVREYLGRVFEHYLNLGFDIFKLDFLYAPGLSAATKTRAMNIDMAMEFIRDCLKDKVIIACQIPPFSAFKHADVIQVGCNIGKDYDGKGISGFLQRERISTKNALTSTIYRRHLAKSSLATFGDVVVLNDKTQLSLSQREALTIANDVFNSVLFVSEDLSKIPSGTVIDLHEGFKKTYKQVRVITHKSHSIIKYAGDSNCHIVDIDLNTGVAK